jgi:hypothetical protein
MGLTRSQSLRDVASKVIARQGAHLGAHPTRGMPPLASTCTVAYHSVNRQRPVPPARCTPSTRLQTMAYVARARALRARAMAGTRRRSVTSRLPGWTTRRAPTGRQGCNPRAGKPALLTVCTEIRVSRARAGRLQRRRLRPGRARHGFDGLGWRVRVITEVPHLPSAGGGTFWPLQTPMPP